MDTSSIFKKGRYAPKWIVLQLLESCNLRCKMCYQWGEAGSYDVNVNKSFLDYNIIEKIINETIHNKPYYALFGGEPLMYPRIWDIVTLIKSKGGAVTIDTNGTLLGKYAQELVQTMPDRLWISLDGPPSINDQQRGKGVYQRVIDGINSLYDEKKKTCSHLPKIGVTCIVTPLNYLFIDELISEYIDLDKIDSLSIELQNFALQKEYDEYVSMLKNEFKIEGAHFASGIVQNIKDFSTIDFSSISRQVKSIRQKCNEKNIDFITSPNDMDEGNISNYFTGKWDKLSNRRSYCALPWIYAEISANGEVTPCHTFYDLTIGNVYDKELLEIWNDEAINKVRKYTRNKLFPICNACSRYHSGMNYKSITS